MKEKWEKLQQLEKQLTEKEYELEQSQKYVEQLKDFFDNHFRQTNSLLENLTQQYSQSKSGLIFEDTSQIVNKEMYEIMDSIEQTEEKVKKEKEAVYEEKEEVFYQKRKLAAEQGESNEH